MPGMECPRTAIHATFDTTFHAGSGFTERYVAMLFLEQIKYCIGQYLGTAQLAKSYL